jgi:hypothetical protein
MKRSRFTEEQIIGILRETRFERVTFAFAGLRDPDCESACTLTPNRLPIVTLVGRPINPSMQCVAGRVLGSDLNADRASDPTPNNRQWFPNAICRNPIWVSHP